MTSLDCPGNPNPPLNQTVALFSTDAHYPI
jgi:hypothetical protein